MININSLSKEYIMGDNKLLALDNIDLSINEGEFVSIMGSSGSGILKGSSGGSPAAIPVR